MISEPGVAVAVAGMIGLVVVVTVIPDVRVSTRLSDSPS